MRDDVVAYIRYLNAFIKSLNNYLMAGQSSITVELYIKKVIKLKHRLDKINLVDLYSSENKIKIDYFNIAIDFEHLSGNNIENRVTKLLKLYNSLQKNVRFKKYSRKGKDYK